MPDHALLSPSSASRWIACTPSARLESTMPQSNSIYAEEGTVAHALAEVLIDAEINGCKPEHLVIIDYIKQDKYYSQEMKNVITAFAEFVHEEYIKVYALHMEAEIHLETKLDLSKWAPESFGTIDVRIVAPGIVVVIDLKYGAGIAVAAEENSQLKLYALAAIEEDDFLYNFDKVIIIIYQPRVAKEDPFDKWETNKGELLHWGYSVVIPKAREAFKGIGVYKPGPHCRFCRVVDCRALAEHNLDLARFEFMQADRLSASDVSDILDQKELFTSWINKIEAFALQQAMEGKEWPGYKLIEGLSKRFIAQPNQEDAEFEMLAAGYDKSEFIRSEFETITNLTKLMGKRKFDNILGSLLSRSQPKPKLVPESAKGFLYDRTQMAIIDFADIEIIDEE